MIYWRVPKLHISLHQLIKKVLIDALAAYTTYMPTIML